MPSTATLSMAMPSTTKPLRQLHWWRQHQQRQHQQRCHQRRQHRRQRHQLPTACWRGFSKKSLIVFSSDPQLSFFHLKPIFRFFLNWGFETKTFLSPSDFCHSCWKFKELFLQSSWLLLGPPTNPGFKPSHGQHLIVKDSNFILLACLFYALLRFDPIVQQEINAAAISLY